MTLRFHTHTLLDINSGPGKAVNGTIMLLIVLNVVAIILESIESLRLDYEAAFWWFEAFSVTVFTIEYLLRVWSSVERPQYTNVLSGRLRYMLTPMAMVDLLAILPSYLSMFLGVDARFLRVVRLLRIFKLSRHLKALDILTTVMRKEAGSLVAAIFILGVMVVIAAGGIYVAERDTQVATFSSIPAAMWWAIVTLSTVGYGDVVPSTVEGKLFGVLVMVIGVGMAALPAGIIASGFSTEMQRRREAYKTKVTQTLQSDAPTFEKEHELEEMREDLGLEESEAETIEAAAMSNDLKTHQTHPQICKHCGKPVE